MASVERECSSDRNTEDVLSDATYWLTAKLKEEQFPICDVTQDAIDLMLNIFLNPNYDMTDIDAFGALQVWLEHCERSRFGRRERSEMKTRPPKPIETAIQRAIRFKKYLSIPVISQAVNDCCDEELLLVENDLQHLRRVARMFAKLLSTELPAEFRLPWDFWRFLFYCRQNIGLHRHNIS